MSRRVCIYSDDISIHTFFIDSFFTSIPALEKEVMENPCGDVSAGLEEKGTDRSNIGPLLRTCETPIHFCSSTCLHFSSRSPRGCPAVPWRILEPFSRPRLQPHPIERHSFAAVQIGTWSDAPPSAPEAPNSSRES